MCLLDWFLEYTSNKHGLDMKNYLMSSPRRIRKMAKIKIRNKSMKATEVIKDHADLGHLIITG